MVTSGYPSSMIRGDDATLPPAFQLTSLGSPCAEDIGEAIKQATDDDWGRFLPKYAHKVRRLKLAVALAANPTDLIDVRLGDGPLCPNLLHIDVNMADIMGVVDEDGRKACAETLSILIPPTLRSAYVMQQEEGSERADDAIGILAKWSPWTSNCRSRQPRLSTRLWCLQESKNCQIKGKFGSSSVDLVESMPSP
ncbi:hypothetical protein FRB94_001557 [Tulasnella sp. JGI-2019a]|nr:hypothetical protein FRB94_001557 [Tulasnella sp. JGI-2019a]